MKTTLEIWKDVPGFEGRYQVSDAGNVRSIPHKVRVVANGIETTRISPGRKLRPGPSKSGHLSVAIGRGNSRLVHQLVMEAFSPKRETGCCDVAHLNGDPTDNRLDNLAYTTRAENNKHVLYHGRRKVTEEQIVQLRNASCYSDAAWLAKDFGISTSHADHIRTRRAYPHV